MSQIICLQILASAVTLAALFSKQTADFDFFTSVVLAFAAVLASIISVLVVRTQDSENKFLKRNLLNLVRSSQTNEYVENEITLAINKYAALIGLPKSKISKYENGMTAFAFYTESSQPRKGLLLLTQTEFNEMAIYDKEDLGEHVSKLFDKKYPDGYDENRNALCDELKRAAQYVAGEHDIDLAISSRIWSDETIIGVATSSNLSQPNVTFDKNEMQALSKDGQMQRHNNLALKIEKFI